MNDAEIKVAVIDAVRDELERSVAPIVGPIKDTLDRTNDTLDTIAKSVQDAVLQQERLTGRIDQNARDIETNRVAASDNKKSIGELAGKLAATREDQSGISARSAVIGGLVLSIVSVLIGLALSGVVG